MAEESGTDLAKLLMPKGVTIAGKIAEKFAGPVWDRYVRKHGVDWTLDQFERELDGVKRAAEMIEESGLPFEPLSAKSMFPTLQGLEVEDDPDLRERWAALLANDATGSSSQIVSFGAMLKELDASEVKLLDLTYARAVRVVPHLRRKIGVNVEGIMDVFDIPRHDLEAQIDNLMRLRLVTAGDLAVLGSVDQYDVVAITPFGQRFVQACRAPGIVDPAPVVTAEEELQAITGSTEPTGQLWPK